MVLLLPMRDSEDQCKGKCCVSNDNCQMTVCVCACACICLLNPILGTNLKRATSDKTCKNAIKIKYW